MFQYDILHQIEEMNIRVGIFAKVLYILFQNFVFSYIDVNNIKRHNFILLIKENCFALFIKIL